MSPKEGYGSRRLPRVGNAERPRPDETVRKQGSADLQNGWLGRHGELSLTDDRLVFVPTVLDMLLRAKRREIQLDDLLEIERWPRHVNAHTTAGRRARLLLHTNDCVYELMVSDMDEWIDALQLVFEHRQRNGREHMPVVSREGYVNMLRFGS